MLQALYFSSVSKKATKSHNRKQERETKFDIFTKLSEPSLARHTPQSKRKEGSGDLAYSELFARNAIITKNVTDNRKNCTAGYKCAPKVGRY